MKNKIILLLALLIIISGTVYLISGFLKNSYQASKEVEPIVIGFSMGTTREERWFTDRDLFVKKAQELGALVSVTLSDYDVDKQISQIEGLVKQGVDVIVVIPADSQKIAPAIKTAKEAGVKVIAYDRLIGDSDIDLYVSFDNVKVGQMEAQNILDIVDNGRFAYIGGSPDDHNSVLLKEGSMKVLADKIASGDIKLVIDEPTPNWDPEEAYKTVKNYLNSGKKLDAVIAANDGTASGVIKALAEFNLDGKIPVSGQDAELAALQRIVAGTQTCTVYKPITDLANKAAELAVALARGLNPETVNFTDNGKIQVPSYFLEPIVVTKNNLNDTVIKDGFHTYNEIYQTPLK
ncbi:MAG: substrate-binding domain-containing protein [Patescibacteria group bacterium]|jgi:D-xylose transport system substrate-binding protein